MSTQPRSLPFPLDTLLFFKRRLNLTDAEVALLGRHRERFLRRKEEIADYLHSYFREIPVARLVLEHERHPGMLKTKWTRWYQSLFETELSESMFQYLWISGLRHVELNVDQRFVNLGYFAVRQFCERIVDEELPPEDHAVVMSSVSKMLDLCLLIQTTAYIAATSQCDVEMVQGIAHQVRNPAMIIGGNVLRLKKRKDEQDPAQRAYDVILSESRRLEKMVTDVTSLSSMYHAGWDMHGFPLEELLADAVSGLGSEGKLGGILPEITLEPGIPDVEGNFRELSLMFRHVLENAMEAADPNGPVVTIAAGPELPDGRFVKVEVFNNGDVPREAELAGLFVPFHSTKPTGTGLGLPIAQMAARKNFGEIKLLPMPDGSGTICEIRLPAAGGGKI